MSPHADAVDPPARIETDGVVPLVDRDEAGRIYDASIHRWALMVAVPAALLFGWSGYAMATGSLPIAGLGQWAVGGPAVGAFTGGGIGAAAGGLAGALSALYRRPARHPGKG